MDTFQDLRITLREMSNLTKQEPEDYFQYEGDCFGHE